MSNNQENDNEKKGFTIIEVMLVLAISGLMLIGVLGGTFDSIRVQRYNDSLNGFAESLRKVYNEVLNPRSNAGENGGASNQAIYGQIVVFGLDGQGDKFYNATLVGKVEPPKKEDKDFIRLLAQQDITINCDTITEHVMTWGSKVFRNTNQQFIGTVVIARSPLSGVVHTAVGTGLEFDIKTVGRCESNKAGERFTNQIKNNPGEFKTTSDVNFCINSDDAPVSRAVRLSADGSNTSAVNILNETDSLSVGC